MLRRSMAAQDLVQRVRALVSQGVFARLFSNLVAEDEPPDSLMIDSTHLKPTRLPPFYKRGAFAGVSGARKVG
jgi:hypothetical protein